MADVMEDYQSSLEDLTFNSKPHINMLTMLAEEYKNHAESIVRLIEARIAKASEKLPLLYLLDSIVKNVGENYKPLFAKNLSSIFKLAFQVGDEKSKLSLYKLRTTWDNYFPLKKLYGLDVAIKELDPNWPVKPLPAHLQDNSATTIHVNPKFIKKGEVSQSNVSSKSTSKKSVHNVTKPTTSSLQHTDAEVDKIRQQLVRQQKELLDLQQKKLMLELEQTKQQLAAKQKVVQKSATKKQEKAGKDPTSTPGNLRVTLANDKAAAPATSNASVKVSAQDPRIKAASTTAGKNNVVAAAKDEVLKSNTIVSPSKKRVSKLVGKKEKLSPKPKADQFSTAKPTEDSKPTKTNKKQSITSPGGRKKKPTSRNRLSPSASPPPPKKPRNTTKTPSSISPPPLPPKVLRNAAPTQQVSERRRRPKVVSNKLNSSKNQRIPKTKDHQKERNSDRSLSPRFSPEPESDDLHPPRNPPPPSDNRRHLPSNDRREDALRRRPSFDPDLFIPKQLTLSHQNEILKQADHQLRTGQLTHRQHQELLKQLHQLFEVQRMKKLHGADERLHEKAPIDPRQSRRRRKEPPPFEKAKQARHEEVTRLPRPPHKNLSQVQRSPERIHQPSPDPDTPKQLEEPEDYIIASLAEKEEDEKISCEEPEDFIISQIPPGAEAYHKHSMSLRRNKPKEESETIKSPDMPKQMEGENLRNEGSDQKLKQKNFINKKNKGLKLQKNNDKKSQKNFDKHHRKEDESLPQSHDNSIVYVIDDEDLTETKPSGKPMERSFPAPPPPPEEMHVRKLTFENEQEARLQRMMQEEQEKMAWEEKLTRELEREQWHEDRLRRGPMRPDRGRGRLLRPTRWKSPPHPPDMREPGSFNIARGQIPRGREPRPRLRRPDRPPHSLPPPPFPPNELMRMRRPVNDPRRPSSPGMIRPPPPPGWESRRPRTPPGLRLPPPPFHEPQSERMADWERHAGRFRPREPLYHPDELRRSPVEHKRRVSNEPPVAPAINQLNVNQLLTDLVSMGIIPGSKKTDSQSPVPSSQTAPEETAKSPDKEEPISADEQQEEVTRSVSPFIEEDLMMLDPDSEIPQLTLSSDLKERHDEIIKRIYTGIQCSACGLRFTTRQTDLYADHLDWHYRINRKDKEGGASTHRELYPTAGDWICYEEIENPQDRAKTAFFDETEQNEDLLKADDGLTVPLTGKAGEDTCKVCKEAFETFYNEATDEWQFANCVKVDDDNFHPNCYGDYNDLLPPSTPLGEDQNEVKNEGKEVTSADVAVKEEKKVDEAVTSEPLGEDQNEVKNEVKEFTSANVIVKEEKKVDEDVITEPPLGENQNEVKDEDREVTSANVIVKEETKVDETVISEPLGEDQLEVKNENEEVTNADVTVEEEKKVDEAVASETK